MNLLSLGGVVGLLYSIVWPLQRKLGREATCNKTIYPVWNKIVVPITAEIEQNKGEYIKLLISIEQHLGGFFNERRVSLILSIKFIVLNELQVLKYF